MLRWAVLLGDRCLGQSKFEPRGAKLFDEHHLDACLFELVAVVSIDAIANELLSVVDTLRRKVERETQCERTAHVAHSPAEETRELAA